MGHLYHGYVCHNQRVYPLLISHMAGKSTSHGSLGPPTTGILAAVEAQGLVTHGQLFLMYNIQ